MNLFNMTAEFLSASSISSQLSSSSSSSSLSSSPDDSPDDSSSDLSSFIETWKSASSSSSSSSSSTFCGDFFIFCGFTFVSFLGVSPFDEFPFPFFFSSDFSSESNESPQLFTSLESFSFLTPFEDLGLEVSLEVSVFSSSEVSVVSSLTGFEASSRAFSNFFDVHCCFFAQSLCFVLCFFSLLLTFFLVFFYQLIQFFDIWQLFG